MKLSRNGIKFSLSLLNSSKVNIHKNLMKAYCGAFWRAMLRTLAPLRRIINRELQVFKYDSVRKDFPISFAIIDHLECGHEYTCLGWDVFDLLFAYTDNPEVRAKRHRCRPCAELLATRKPVQSVALASKRAVSA